MLAALAVVGAAVWAHRVQGPPADLVWTAGPEIDTLDPARITALQDGRVAAALFEGLTVLDPKDLSVQPGVAERWDVSADKLTYTFHLRPEARWSDGRPVTAEDFAWSWRRVLDPKTASEYVYMLYPIRGARAYYAQLQASYGEPEASTPTPTPAAKPDGSTLGVRVEGPDRLVVTLEQPTAYFLDLAAFSTYLPVRRDVVEARQEPDGTAVAENKRWTFPPNLISNGAYRLVEWDFRSRMRWERNPYYWNAGHVALERIEVRVFDPNTALLAYETGAVDLAALVPSLAIEPLLDARREGKRSDVLYGNNLGTYFYRFNCAKKPLDDVRIRRALALAIDRKAIIERAARGGQPPATTLVPPGMKGYTSPPGLVEDVGEARRLLAEAGYPDGAGFPELAILVNKSGDHVPMAEMVQDEWHERLGINVRIDQVEWKVFLNMIQKGEYQVARAGWYGDYADPNTFIDMFVTGGGNNETGWSDARYDALVARAAREPDSAVRMRILAEAEARLVAEVPIMPIYGYTIMMLARPGLEGLDMNLMNRIDFSRLRRAKLH
jgi:oligopeptide transport system substrate-binding protein